jgi:hypothetical protein
VHRHFRTPDCRAVPQPRAVRGSRTVLEHDGQWHETSSAGSRISPSSCAHPRQVTPRRRVASCCGAPCDAPRRGAALRAALHFRARHHAAMLQHARRTGRVGSPHSTRTLGILQATTRSICSNCSSSCATRWVAKRRTVLPRAMVRCSAPGKTAPKQTNKQTNKRTNKQTNELHARGGPLSYPENSGSGARRFTQTEPHRTHPRTPSATDTALRCAHARATSVEPCLCVGALACAAALPQRLHAAQVKRAAWDTTK